MFAEDLDITMAGGFKIYIAEQTITSFPVVYKSGEEMRLAPPNWYLAFTPLANLTSAVLSSLNELRNVAMLSIRHRLFLAFKSHVLDQVTRCLAQVPEKSKVNFFGDSQLQDHHFLLCKSLLLHTIPFLTTCIQSVFLVSGDSFCNLAASKIAWPLTVFV